MAARIGVAAALVAMAAAAVVYAVSERVLHRQYDVTVREIEIPTDSISVAEGARLAGIRGCRGCHGSELEGSELYDDFWVGRYVAPNLTRVAARYSPGEMARAIRDGVRANGEGLWAMPSAMYYHLSDDDLARIIAWIRGMPPAEGGFDYEFRPGPLVRWGLLTGGWWAIPDDVRRLGPRMPAPDPADTIAYGEYLARTSCTECHGVDFQGERDGGAPNLVVAVAYGFEDFTRFMRTGTAIGERELPMMSRVARGRFSFFTDGELRSLYRFLQARAR